MSSCMTSHLLRPNDCALASWRNGSIDNKQWQWISTISEHDAAPLVKATCYTMNNPPRVSRKALCLLSFKMNWKQMNNEMTHFKKLILIFENLDKLGHRCFPLSDICDVKTKHSCSEGSAEDVETYTLVMQWSWYLFYLMMTKPCFQWLKVWGWLSLPVQGLL